MFKSRESRGGCRRFRASSGGHRWWAHLEFSRINIELTILLKKMEEQLILGACVAVSNAVRCLEGSKKASRLRERSGVRGLELESSRPDQNWSREGDGLLNGNPPLIRSVECDCPNRITLETAISFFLEGPECLVMHVASNSDVRITFRAHPRPRTFSASVVGCSAM